MTQIRVVAVMFGLKRESDFFRVLSRIQSEYKHDLLKISDRICSEFKTKLVPCSWQDFYEALIKKLLSNLSRIMSSKAGARGAVATRSLH